MLTSNRTIGENPQIEFQNHRLHRNRLKSGNGYLRVEFQRPPISGKGKSCAICGFLSQKMSLGQKSSTDPGAMLTSLLNKREKLRQELRSIEKQVRAPMVQSRFNCEIRFHREIIVWGILQILGSL